MEEPCYTRHMLKRLLLPTLLSFSFSALAIVGNDLTVTDKGHDNVCRLLIEDKSGFGICSGSLIKPNQILTAAHCFDHMSKDTTITVGCGYRGIDQKKVSLQKSKAGNLTYKEGVRFLETAKGTTYKLHPNWVEGKEEFDQAVLNLDHPLKIKTMAIDETPANIPMNCFSGGYGINKDIRMGILNIGQIHSEQLRENSFEFVESKFVSVFTDVNEDDYYLADPQMILKYALRDTMDYAVMVYGDSGGPVFCKYSESTSGEYFQVGLNRVLPYSLKQRGQTNVFDITFTSGFSFVDLDFALSF